MIHFEMSDYIGCSQPEQANYTWKLLWRSGSSDNKIYILEHKRPINNKQIMFCFDNGDNKKVDLPLPVYESLLPLKNQEMPSLTDESMNILKQTYPDLYNQMCEDESEYILNNSPPDTPIQRYYESSSDEDYDIDVSDTDVCNSIIRCYDNSNNVSQNVSQNLDLFSGAFAVNSGSTEHPITINSTDKSSGYVPYRTLRSNNKNSP